MAPGGVHGYSVLSDRGTDVRRPLILLSAAATLALSLAGPARAASPTVTLDAPAANAVTSGTPTFGGTTDTNGFDVTVNVYDGSDTTGALLQSPTATPSAGNWSVTASPALPTGTYTAQAKQSNGVDPLGQSNTRTFKVDASAPASSVGSSPLTNQTSFSVSYSASDDGDAGLDHVDLYAKGPADAAYSLAATNSSGGATGTFTYTASQGDGAYSFYTRAVDKVGNVESAAATPDSITNLDTRAPAVSLAAPADGSSTNNTTPPFYGAAGTAGGDSSTVTVEIYPGNGVAGSPQLVAAAVSGGGWVTAAGLAPGTYTARARQSDAAGNTGFSPPHTFTIDTSPPGVVILSGPSGTVGSTSATFTFGASEAANFECRLDGGAYLPCASPVAYSNLGQGSHTFEVRATDLSGNTNPASAIASWRVDSSKPALAPIKPFPIVRMAGRLTRKGVSLTAFEVVAVPGARIEVSCKGRTCPVRRTTRTVSRSASAKARAATRVRLTRFRRLNAGVVLEVRITKSGAIGKYTRFVIRRGKLPSRTDACLNPGQIKAVECPS
ncbi:MAG: large repetitive protein [Solirubrobacteraceae bacterium]|nr:large repetitive protein [Solirubrobacteraceae bacterium]